MIWESIYLMTGFDLVIMGTVAFAIWTLVTQWRTFRGIKFTGGFAVMCLGILSIGLLYAFDLGLMFVWPGFVPRAEAMAAMENLHLNYSWGFISADTLLIVTGFAAVNRTTGAVIERAY